MLKINGKRELYNYLRYNADGDFELKQKFKNKLSSIYFVIEHRTKIVVDLLYSSDPRLIGKRRKKFVSRGFKYFYIVRGADSTSAMKGILFELGRPEFLETKAEELNNNLPKSEKWFLNKIEKEPIFSKFEFDQNVPLFNKFIYDLFSKKYRVAIEIDGSWHDKPEQKQRDLEKDRAILIKNFIIIRVKAYSQESYNDCVQFLNEIISNPKVYKNFKKKKYDEKVKDYWLFNSSDKREVVPAPPKKGDDNWKYSRTKYRKSENTEIKEDFIDKVNSIDFKKKMPF